jgi:hypothetical protein
MTTTGLIALVNSRAPSAHFHIQTQRRRGTHLLPQSSLRIPYSFLRHCWRCSWRIWPSFLAKSLLSLSAGVFWPESASTHSSDTTRPSLRPRPPRQSPYHESEPAAYNICHVIAGCDNTSKGSSRHELFLHPAHATGPPNSVALPAAPDVHCLEWLVHILQPVPAQPIEHTVEQCLPGTRATRPPPGHERGGRSLTTALRELLWLRRHGLLGCLPHQRAQGPPPAAAGAPELAHTRNTAGQDNIEQPHALPFPHAVAKRGEHTAAAI